MNIHVILFTISTELHAGRQMQEKQALRRCEHRLTVGDSPRHTLSVIMGCRITMATHPVMC